MRNGTTLIEESVSETMLSMSDQLFSKGLNHHQLDDSILLAETVVALVMRDMIIAGKSIELMATLASIHRTENVGFLEKMTNAFRWSILEKKLIKAYKNTLIDRMLLNKVTATVIAEESMRKVMLAVSTSFIKANIQGDALTKLIDASLPTYPPVASVLK